MSNLSQFENDLSNLNIALGEDETLETQWQFLFLVTVPIACIVGNVLVILAVWTTKSLQTPTNYLLVSLACADLLIGSTVMPFSIYVTVNNLHWHLSALWCHLYTMLDVCASTASIVHLVLISIDRLVAATKPAEYKTMKHRRRVYCAIFGAWCFSIFLALPLVSIGHANTELVLQTKHHCGIYNPMYMLYSSIFAFYLPCVIMLLTYGYIFYTLKKRLRAIQLQEMAGGQFLGFGADVGNIAQSAIETVIGIEPRNRNMISWEKPLLKKIEETAAEHASSLNDSEREQIQNLLDAYHPSSSGSQELTTLDEYPERPPSVVLEAVTLKQQIYESAQNSPKLEVPPSSLLLQKISKTRRFSETLQTTLTRTRRKSCTNNNNVNNYESFSFSQTKNRRFSVQPASMMAQNQPRDSQSLLRPYRGGKQMRRLSEIISDWERPSRSSLSQMYSFARRESVYIARKKLAGLKDWALDLLAKLKSKQGMAVRREARATKLVATVMCVFLICWLPFFTLNTIKVYLLMVKSWDTDYEGLFHWLTALGYLNSSLNFFIYSAINKKFRSSFRRLIGLRRGHQGKTWMLPPKQTKQQKTKCSCGCQPFKRVKETTLRKASSVGMLGRRFEVNKPEIVIDEVVSVINQVSISEGGRTTFRRSSDDAMHRSSSEILGGVTFPSNHDSRRGSGMSNSSASLQLHDMHQIAEASLKDAEIFV
ncbi:unnamed protein product [Bursaphelenchus okinawaensis]|uniref:G-protein coupled receptors family 1 profile domain-containing protein n=1 Tax=Bursaphelenchus okinawaensis TaxID=465554 RepID=A0A811LKA6_9BILA|nr:unnamed protein product [Bursaphelenchus okinawaensis]CAG9124645.1 unnamed protein product [Bursaphelenchus okinawaensis]